MKIESGLSILDLLRGGTQNEFGAFLPDEKAQPCEETERIQANNQKEADKKCEKIAEEYGGTCPDAKPVGKRQFDCQFKVWR